jgi:Spy/CpxP family protein refolding chaperone
MVKHACGWALVLITMLAAATVQANDGPHGRWWNSPQVVDQLQLSPGEIQQLASGYEASRLKMIHLKSQVEAEQFKLQTLVEKPDMDDDAIKAQHRALEQARSQLADERFAFFLEVRKILGPDRFQRMMDMAPRGHRSHR